MFWALALILLAVAGFSALLVRRRVGPGIGTDRQPSSLDADSLRGFFYVGSGALTLLAVAVVVLGLVFAASGRGEALAVLGFFAYGAYLAAAVTVLWFTHRKA